MFHEVFVKGAFWLIAFIVGIIFAILYFFVLPAVIIELVVVETTIISYLLGTLFSVVIHFFFYIRFLDYKEKKEHQERIIRMNKFLKEKWGKDV